ncbi:MAG: 7TMR-DISM family protein, partial [Bacteroidia bacterium]
MKAQIYTAPAPGPDAIHKIEDLAGRVSIGRSLSFYEDQSGKMPFEQIQRQHFIPENKDVPNFNITKNAVWCKVNLTCEKEADWYLKLDPASFNQVLFYQRTGKEGWHEQRVGNAFPRQERPLQVNHFMFRLNLHAGDTTEVYLKVQDYYPIQFEMAAGTLESFVGPFHASNLYNGICYGIMIMMLIYNFFLFITQKSVVYIYYVLYVFCSMLFSAYLSGYALYFPKPVTILIQFAPIIPPAGFGVFGLLFTLRLFNEDLTPRFRRVVAVFIAVALADVVFSAIPALVHLSENIIQPLGLLLGILCISAAIIARRHSSAKYYLVGFGAYMFALFYLILTAQGVFSMSEAATHAMPTGSAIESI